MTTASTADGKPESTGPSRSLWRRFLHRPLGVISLVAFSLVLLVAILAPLLATYDPNLVDFTQVKAPPSAEHWLGGDSSGRDIFSRLLYGARTTIYGAVVACVVAIVMGVPFGVLAGYARGRIDVFCTWVSDAIQSIPGMLALLIVAAGTGSNFTLLMITLGVFISPGYFRISRSRTVHVRGEAYVDAARVAGLGDLRILATHVVKAVYAPVIIQTGLTGGLAMGIQAGLQFLGVGSSDTPSWGAMMNDGFHNMLTNPLMLLWPSIALAICIASLAIMGSTLGDLVSVRTPMEVRKNRKSADDRGEQAPSSGSLQHRAQEAALSISNLSVRYQTPAGVKEVLHRVNLDAAPGEVLGIVGESGSGKTQTILSVLNLLPAGASVDSESLWVDGTEVSGLGAGKRQSMLGTRIGYIPQEPMSNLDPSYPVGRHLTEPLRKVHGLSKNAARERAREVLTRVGIHDPDRIMASYPHQVSGGIAQRVLIAGAVISRPPILLADEPTTALDVTVQAEVLELLRDLQHEYAMALVIVTHNFGVVADICDRVVVMKDGDVVETGDVAQTFAHPQDPYTTELIAASLDDAADRHTLDAEFARAAGEGKTVQV